MFPEFAVRTEAQKKSDFNAIRDIRRRTIYDKSVTDRRISVETFYPFSITIGAIRKRLFKKNTFPEHFRKNGAEDVLLQILHLHDRHIFYYTPSITGLHDHNLTPGDLLRKFFIELNGTKELFLDITGKRLRIPYQFGFLSCPVFLFLSVLLTIFFRPAAPLAVALFFVELMLAARCFFDRTSTVWFRAATFIYVTAGECIKIGYIPWFLFGKPLSMRNLVRRVGQLFFWEKEKFTRIVRPRLDPV